MLFSIYSAKEHSGTVSELAKHLGLVPFEVGCPEIIEALTDRIQGEIDRHYMPLPFDANYNSINVGDKLDVGQVVGVGDGYVFVSDKPEGDVTRYLSRETKHEDKSKELLTSVQNAINDGSLNDAQMQGIINYIKRCYDVG